MIYAIKSESGILFLGVDAVESTLVFGIWKACLKFDNRRSARDFVDYLVVAELFRRNEVHVIGRRGMCRSRSGSTRRGVKK